MNSVYQNKNTVSTLNRYKNENDVDSFILLINKYSSDVKDKVVSVLQKTKKMTEDEADKFMKNLFSLGPKREKSIADEVENCYVSGKSLEQCANILIDKYYSITKNNKYVNTIRHQTNRDVSGEGEVTEVDESFMYASKINEKTNYDNFKKVSISLFWNFLYRSSDMGLNFLLDISHIKNIKNSLNTSGYVLYMTTNEINKREVIHEFKHSVMLSKMLDYILSKNPSEDNISFYVGFDGNAHLHFGFIMNDNKYKIGYADYKSGDFQKVIPYIKPNKNIDLIKLSKKFVTNTVSLSSIRASLDSHLHTYEDIEIYNTISDDNFGIVIESYDDDVITQPYIDSIIKKCAKISHHSKWEIQKVRNGNKTIYYFTMI